MKIAIIGYGRMGKEVEISAKEKGLEITCVIDNEQDWNTNKQDLERADVAIEFTSPDVVIGNIKKLARMGIPVVTGTTGWYDQLNMISDYIGNCNAGLFYASNFSIGVNILFAVNSYLARIMNDYTDYKVTIDETHHTNKLDSPSGTAETLADQIISSGDRYKKWVLHPGVPGNDGISVVACRVPDVVGEHTVKYKSEIDEVSIHHSAKSRKGFAMGAVLAASWMVDKKGVFTMKDLINI